ncbi:MAG: hypothetical protein WCQ89_02490 [Verrucomicrobiota bacterium]|jgi:hypothetical protein
MARQLTADDAKQSLTGHVTHKGLEVFAKYGPRLGWTQLQQLLNDRAYVRYPCDIIFDTAALHEGEFAHPEPKGATPEAGFTMFVHPVYMLDLERVPALVLYQLVALNYGEFASAEDAESFGAAALGLTRDEYYDQICELATQVGVVVDDEGPLMAESGGCGSGGGGSGGCSCGH